MVVVARGESFDDACHGGNSRRFKASMLIAVLADIHANREALDAVLERLREFDIDRLVLLGDLVGYGPDPGYAVDTAIHLVEEGGICLLGNHDEAVIGSPAGMNENARAAIFWTQRQLNSAQSRFLSGLTLVHRERGFLFTHASASRPATWPYVRDAADAERCLQASDAATVVCGHTHIPAIFYGRPGASVASFTPLANKPAPLLATRRHVVVAGSVGQPRDGNPAACVALLDDEEMTVTMLRIPYDFDTTAEKIRTAGLPGWLGMRLKIGR